MYVGHLYMSSGQACNCVGYVYMSSGQACMWVICICPQDRHVTMWVMCICPQDRHVCGSSVYVLRTVMHFISNNEICILQTYNNLNRLHVPYLF